MPSSKEVRARQNRQKERVAVATAERHRQQLRRRRIGAGVAVILLVGAIVVGLVANANNSGTVAASPTTTPAPTNQCVGLKDPLPKGSPAMPLTAGAAPTTLIKKDLKVGTGAVIPANAKVTMNYVGVACSTGKIFDSTYAHNQTFPADLSSAGKLITGWQQGIPGMRIGGVRLLSIPASLAYGSQGNPPAIGPDEALFFLVAAEKLG